jgi:GTPase Era involved in 16S rRNA processing
MHIQERILKLQQSLVQENPVLLGVVSTYRQLDQIAQGIGVLDQNASYVEQISWWPLIAVLGTFSAGKSSFINQFVGRRVQDTGNQAVDDRFSVICYGGGSETMTLPGLALDADPRFPFYGIRHEIDRVTEGEGNRIDSYLQLKTVPEPSLRGKILIDSPGFDADSQRDTVLKIADHIIGMSDLVLVFFDARHPEPGAMRDTLKHLVEGTHQRHDADKFLFILNQIDTAANEDNPEAVMGAWQRALASSGLVGGKFYMIYNEQAATPIADASLAERFKRKKDVDLAEIYNRMDKVSVERAYRISFALETLSDQLEKEWLPKIDRVRLQWAKRVVISDVLLASFVSVALMWLSINTYLFTNIDLSGLIDNPIAGLSITALMLFVLLAPHYYFRQLWASVMTRRLQREDETGALARALARNTVFWRPMFAQNPRGWGGSACKRLADVRDQARRAIQKLNDQFARPAGETIR